MRLKECKFLADENIDPAVVAFLQSCGFDVQDVKNEDLAGTDDLTLLRLFVLQ